MAVSAEGVMVLWWWLMPSAGPEQLVLSLRSRVGAAGDVLLSCAQVCQPHQPVLNEC